MPGALKARDTDGGNTMKTARVAFDEKFVVAGEVDVDILDRGRTGGSYKEKRKRRKRKLSSADVEGGCALDEPLDRIVRHAMGLRSLPGCTSQRNGDVTQVINQNQTRESSTGNDMEASVKVKTPAGSKLNKKKRKRLEEELRKGSTGTASSLVATTQATSGATHNRVWQYVCNRAVLVHWKDIRHSEVETESHDSANPRFGSSTVVTEIQVAGRKIVVTNTKEGAVAQQWLNRQKGTVFGLDAEWRPSYTKGTEHKVALLQICGESECLIVQMLYVDFIPRGLVNFLKDPAIKFPGVGIQGDAMKLKKDWGLECNGTIDLTALAAKILGRPELKYTGLKALAKVVMDYDMAKPKRVTMSNWAKPVLDKVQVEYASLDAWVSYAIHQKLFQPSLESGIDT